MTDPHAQKNNNEDVNKKAVNVVAMDFSTDGLILNVLWLSWSHGIDSISVPTKTLVKINEKC